MSAKLLVLSLGAALSVSAMAAPAVARDIAIDGDASFVVPACTLGQACGGTTLPFSIITPAVTTNQIFIYNSGIVSLGSQLPLGAAYGDVSTLGHAFLAPGFANFGSAIPTTYTTDVTDNFDGFTGAFRVTWAFPNGDPGAIFQLQLTDLSLNVVLDPTNTNGFFIEQDPNRIGDVRVDFAHGSTFDFWNGLTVLTDPGLPSGAIVGWGVGALNSATIFGDDVSSLKQAQIGVDLTGAAAYVGIPEPATWISMILGFAGLGAVLRRRRRQGFSTAV